MKNETRKTIATILAVSTLFAMSTGRSKTPLNLPPKPLVIESQDKKQSKLKKDKLKKFTSL